MNRPVKDPVQINADDDRLLCSNCNREINGIIVASPTLDARKRQLCTNCAEDIYGEDIL